MFRPIHGHHQVDLTLKILLCKRVMISSHPHHSSFIQQNLKSYDQPDDGHELAETFRCILIRIYFSSHNCCVIDYLQHIYFYTHNGDDIPKDYALIFTVVTCILILSKFLIYQLMHTRIALKRILKFTLKQLLHISVQSPSSGSALFELAKVIVVKIIN